MGSRKLIIEWKLNASLGYNPKKRDCSLLTRIIPLFFIYVNSPLGLLAVGTEAGKYKNKIHCSVMNTTEVFKTHSQMLKEHPNGQCLVLPTQVCNVKTWVSK